MAAEEGAETLPAEQGAVGARSASPSLEEFVRDAHGRLADLFQAASSILVEMRSLPSTAKEGAAELPGRGDSAAISKKAGTPFCRQRGALSPPSLKRGHQGVKKMLELVKDLHTVLPAEDGEVSSLKISRCIQAQQTLQHDRVLVACSASFAESEAHADEEPGSACSLHQRSGVRWGDGDRRRDDRRSPSPAGHLLQLRPAGARPVGLPVSLTAGPGTSAFLRLPALE
ncbi:unnamed protein product [Lampetra fluviatilis]